MHDFVGDRSPERTVDIVQRAAAAKKAGRLKFRFDGEGQPVQADEAVLDEIMGGPGFRSPSRVKE